MREPQIGDCYRIVHRGVHNWIPAHRTIVDVSTRYHEYRYTLSNGDTFSRDMQVVHEAIACGDWALVHPGLLLPKGA